MHLHRIKHGRRYIERKGVPLLHISVQHALLANSKIRIDETERDFVTGIFNDRLHPITVIFTEQTQFQNHQADILANEKEKVAKLNEWFSGKLGSLEQSLYIGNFWEDACP